MSHDEFKDKLLKAMGGVVPMSARERWGKFLRTRGTEFTLRYDWIRHGGFYRWILDSPEVDFGDGAETITVWTV